MLKVHKMPLKNHFLTGIGSGYNKTPNQNELQPFTSGYTFDFLGKESCRSVTDIFTPTGMLYNTMIKPNVGMIPFDGDFEPIRFNFEIETAKSDKFLLPFTS